MSLIKKIYICLFAVLYLCVAFTSTLHAIEFFGLANAPWLAVILAISFELGQAAVLFELLTSKKDRTKIMPWVLMTIFTLVQVLGNVYSSYKYIVIFLQYSSIITLKLSLLLQSHKISYTILLTSSILIAFIIFFICHHKYYIKFILSGKNSDFIITKFLTNLIQMI